MVTNCASPLTDLFLYSYDAYFIKGLLQKNEKKLAIYIYIYIKPDPLMSFH
jgi:hypothetical protein